MNKNWERGVLSTLGLLLLLTFVFRSVALDDCDHSLSYSECKASHGDIARGLSTVIDCACDPHRGANDKLSHRGCNYGSHLLCRLCTIHPQEVPFYPLCPREALDQHALLEQGCAVSGEDRESGLNALFDPQCISHTMMDDDYDTMGCNYLGVEGCRLCHLNSIGATGSKKSNQKESEGSKSENGGKDNNEGNFYYKDCNDVVKDSCVVSDGDRDQGLRAVVDEGCVMIPPRENDNLIGCNYLGIGSCRICSQDQNNEFALCANLESPLQDSKEEMDAPTPSTENNRENDTPSSCECNEDNIDNFLPHKAVRNIRIKPMNPDDKGKCAWKITVVLGTHYDFSCLKKLRFQEMVSSDALYADYAAGQKKYEFLVSGMECNTRDAYYEITFIGTSNCILGKFKSP